MNASDRRCQLDVAVCRYLEAVEHGYLDTVAEIWQQAAADQELERILHDLNAERLAVPENIPKCSVLVVDDEEYIRDLLVRVLAADFEVLTANSGAAAQAIFARREVDILLADQQMPGMTGVELLEWVRERSPKTVPLLMTGYADLNDAVEAINRGHVYHYLAKPFTGKDGDLRGSLHFAADKFRLERRQEHLLEQMQQVKDELEQRVRARTEELKLQAMQMQLLALTDPLTGLLNRRAIDGVAASELKRHVRYGRAVAVGLIDVDHFKQINTQYLQIGGDRALIGLAETLSKSLRGVDHVGRYGGEEFLVVAPETSPTGIVALAERIRAAVENTPIYYKEQRIPLTISVGFAVAEAGSAADHEQLLEAAGAALRDAKAAGRNRCIVRSVAAPRITLADLPAG